MIDFELTSVRPDPFSVVMTLRPIRPGGDSVNTITLMTRREQAEALSDLYEVPLADLYRRYGAVLLPPASRPVALWIQRSAEVVRGK